MGINCGYNFSLYDINDYKFRYYKQIYNEINSVILILVKYKVSG